MKVVELVRLDQPKADDTGAAPDVNGTTTAKPHATDLFAPQNGAAPTAEGVLPAPTAPNNTQPAPEPAPLPIPPEPTHESVTPEK